jgi:hypothetical protein
MPDFENPAYLSRAAGLHPAAFFIPFRNFFKNAQEIPGNFLILPEDKI